MLDLIEGETLTVLRKGARDDYGDAVTDDFVESHTIDDAIVEHENMSTSMDNGDRQDRVTITGHIYVPLGSDVLPTDLIERANGDRLKILGKPFEYDFGLASGVAFKFREVL